MGNDKVSFIVYSVDGISIHVPSWGTTAESLIWPLCILFQSTFPRGERHTVIDTYKRFKDFNPRSLVGNDWIRRSTGALPSISIHVPSWGTTSICADFASFVKDFNPRSLVGNDRFRSEATLHLHISIHVPSWGTTANFHKYSLFFYAINIIFLLFIIPSLFSLVLFMLLF